jgi:hypothetical protein
VYGAAWARFHPNGRMSNRAPGLVAVATRASKGALTAIASVLILQWMTAPAALLAPAESTSPSRVHSDHLGCQRLRLPDC